MILIGVAIGATLCLLLNGPVRMLAAMWRINVADRQTTMDFLAVCKYGGTSFSNNRLSNVARMVALRKMRRMYPTASDADLAQWLSSVFGQANPLLQSERIYSDQISRPRLFFIYAWRIVSFAIRY